MDAAGATGDGAAAEFGVPATGRPVLTILGRRWSPHLL
jgi:hypothetical protein